MLVEPICRSVARRRVGYFLRKVEYELLLSAFREATLSAHICEDEFRTGDKIQIRTLPRTRAHVLSEVFYVHPSDLSVSPRYSAR